MTRSSSPLMLSALVIVRLSSFVVVYKEFRVCR
jgi:hypothetical protein